MPHNSSQWVSHIIEGGWATDYGNTFYGSPQGGEIRIPWCKKCENVRFHLDGSFGKHPGTYRIVNAPIKAPQSGTGFVGSSFAFNVFDYISMGASLTGTRKRVAIVGSWLYDITNMTPLLIGDIALASGSVCQMTTFNDLLIIAGGPNSPKSWDQTTFQSLAGTPPIFTFSTPHSGRHWAAGSAALPSRLYYSAVGNPEDWVGSGSGSIDINPGDGDAIVGILSWKKELWVFKGPHKLSIHRITGTDPSDFARSEFVTGISAAGQGSIFSMGDDFGFWSPRGSCHSLSATAAYGDYTQAYLNFPILSWCRNPDNISSGEYSRSWQAVTDISQSITYVVFNNNNILVDTDKPHVVLGMDWKFRSDSNPYPRFIQMDLKHKITCLGMTSGVFDASQLQMTFGSTDGVFIQEVPDSTPFYASDSLAFPMTVETPALTYGPPSQKKTLISVGVSLDSNYSTISQLYATLNFTYGGRGAPAQTIDFTNKGGIPLGTFVLDEDQLDGGENIHEFNAEANGEAIEFSYRLGEDGTLFAGQGTNVRTKYFHTLITPSGESLENS